MRALRRLAAKLEAQAGTDPDAADRTLSELWKADATDVEARNLLHALRRTRALEALAALRAAAEPGSDARRKAVEAAVQAYDRVLELAPGDADAQIGAGDALFQVGDFAAARDRYEKAQAAAPTSIWIRNLAARAGLLDALGLARAGKPDDAARVVGHVVLLGPPRLDLGFASLEAELTRLVPAAQALADGTGVESGIAAAVLLGAAYLVGGAEGGDLDAAGGRVPRDDPGDGIALPKEDGAEAALRRATSLLGGPAPAGSRLESLADTAMLLRAIVRGRRADVDGARSDLRSIRSRFPNDPLVRHHLVLLDRLTAGARGRIADATGDAAGVAAAKTLEAATLAEAERLADASPPWAGPGLLVAEMQLQRGDYLEALRRLSSLGEKFPLDAAIHRGIAAVYQAQMLQSGARNTMLLQQAREALTRAKELDPRDPRTALDMSQLYRLAGDLETAARNALQARSVEPIAGPAAQAFAAIRVEQGRKAIEKHELEKATAYAKDAAEADERSAAPWVLDGDVAIAMQDLKRALASFLRAREIDPSSREAVRALADCRRRRGAAYFAWKIVHPEPKAVRGVEPDPKAVEDWRRKNLAALRQAIGEFEAAIRLEPEGPDADSSNERLEQLGRELHRLDPDARRRDMTAAQDAFEAGEKLRRDEHFVDALVRYRDAVAAWPEFLPGWMRSAEMASVTGADHDVEGFRAIDVIRDLDANRQYPEPDLYAGELWARRATSGGGGGAVVADAKRRARASLERFLERARTMGDGQRAIVARAELLLGRLGR
jgi:tetratricopeptide (TPR) repeat protein